MQQNDGTGIAQVDDGAEEDMWAAAVEKATAGAVRLLHPALLRLSQSVFVS